MREEREGKLQKKVRSGARRFEPKSVRYSELSMYGMGMRAGGCGVVVNRVKVLISFFS